uniref:Sarcolipin n=1 Tax=Heterorhabditis bacteriophora TaxID=37862 RepID=A0A1I7WA63_HETBA
MDSEKHGPRLNNGTKHRSPASTVEDKAIERTFALLRVVSLTLVLLVLSEIILIFISQFDK